MQDIYHSNQKFSGLSSVYTSLKYKYHCNLVHILPAEAFPPPKTAQNPAPKMLPKWEQQTPMLCRAGPLFY